MATGAMAVYRPAMAAGETGHLVDYEAHNPTAFTTTLAARIQELLSDPDEAAKMGKAGRQRVLERFGWPAIASRTVELYTSLL